MQWRCGERQDSGKQAGERGNAYVVVSSGPGRVELHVQLSFFSGQLVVLGLLFPSQRVPLQSQVKTNKTLVKTKPDRNMSKIPVHSGHIVWKLNRGAWNTLLEDFFKSSSNILSLL